MIIYKSFNGTLMSPNLIKKKIIDFNPGTQMNNNMLLGKRWKNEIT